mmetsp:Transcript_30133/g.70898  ORF Transcript_30133/g.70898 Transcript_30133/m.70898 type:complete len:333 (-) Transcript_30133:24-1022(-)
MIGANKANVGKAGPYSTDNVWIRNSYHGQILIIVIALNTALGTLVLGFSMDAAELGAQLEPIFEAFTREGVSNVDDKNAITLLDFIGKLGAGVGLGIAAMTFLMCFVGMHALLRQGKLAFLCYTIFCASACIIEVAFGALILGSAYRVINAKEDFKEMCVISTTEELAKTCSDSLDTQIGNIEKEVLGLTISMFLQGLVWALMAVLALFARLNAPRNLAKLRLAEARKREAMLKQQRAVEARQKEQSKISQAFRLLDAFQMFDLDGNGTIDGPELQTVLGTLGYKFSEKEAEDMLREADVDGDGTIDYQEFIKMMMTSNKIDMEKVVASGAI